jgi:hypothetical protein
MSRSKEPGFSLITGEAEVAFADDSVDPPATLQRRIEGSAVHAGGRLMRRTPRTHPVVEAELAMLHQLGLLKPKATKRASLQAPAPSRS